MAQLLELGRGAGKGKKGEASKRWICKKSGIFLVNLFLTA